MIRYACVDKSTRWWKKSVVVRLYKKDATLLYTARTMSQKACTTILMKLWPIWTFKNLREISHMKKYVVNRCRRLISRAKTPRNSFSRLLSQTRRKGIHRLTQTSQKESMWIRSNCQLHQMPRSMSISKTLCQLETVQRALTYLHLTLIDLNNGSKTNRSRSRKAQDHGKSPSLLCCQTS